MLCFLVPHSDGYEELHFKQDGAPPLFIFPVHCGLRATLLVGGLAVEDQQQNGLCAVAILLHEMLGNTVSVLILTNDT
jgi:hypothetical protein